MLSKKADPQSDDARRSLITITVRTAVRPASRILPLRSVRAERQACQVGRALPTPAKGKRPNRKLQGSQKKERWLTTFPKKRRHEKGTKKGFANSAKREKQRDDREKIAQVSHHRAADRGQPCGMQDSSFEPPSGDDKCRRSDRCVSNYPKVRRNKKKNVVLGPRKSTRPTDS